MIISFVNQKGGVGKSTLSAHLARWLQLEGYSVALADCDPQLSSSAWLRAANFENVYQIESTDDIMERLPLYATETDFLIVDSAAGLTEQIRALLLRADVVVIPAGASGIDIKSTADTIRLCNQARSVRGDRPSVGIVLSRAKKGTRLKTEAIAVLSDMGVPLLSQPIHDKQIIADTFGQKSFVFDMDGLPAADASKEFHALFRELIKL